MTQKSCAVGMCNAKPGNHLNKGVIVESTHSQGEFVSSIFLGLKKNGVDYRMILNLKELNKISSLFTGTSKWIHLRQ